MTAAKKNKTKTADPTKKPQELLAKMVKVMREMFVEDNITLKPNAMARKWRGIDSTEVFVLLIAGGKGKGKDRNPRFTVGGVFATASLADDAARGMGIDGKDIVRSWDDEITGDSIQLDTIYRTGMTIPMGKAIIVWARVEGLVLNAAELLSGNAFDPMGANGAAAKALDALFDPTNPRGIPEAWVSLDFNLKTKLNIGSGRKPWKIPTVGLRVLPFDPKTHSFAAAQGWTDGFVKFAVTRSE